MKRLIAIAIAGMLFCGTAEAQVYGTTPISSGLFTPSITFQTPGDLVVNTASGSGTYTQVANQVCFTLTVTGTPVYTTASGDIRINLGTLPSSNSTIISQLSGIINSTVTWPVGTTQVTPIIQTAVNYVSLRGSGTATSVSNFTTTNFPTGSPYNIRISGCYYTS